MPMPPSGLAWPPGAARRRRRAAIGRLRAARSRFDGSLAALRKAALDHVDSQAVLCTALRACLARLAAGTGPGLDRIASRTHANRR
ncbi:hypothetical protein [Methylobacterium nigriterrae]|uniref:hypothetical protein n=1 Tax=Methylobacterium nigriterrae TaxID=3127512 RepID=UPI0030138DEB